MIVLPVAIAVLLFKKLDHRKLAYIFIGLLIQYVLLIAFAEPISSIWGTSIKHTLAWFSYIGTVFPWPFMITLIQYISVLLFKKRQGVNHE